MIGCLIVGGLAVAGFAKLARHHYYGGGGCRGRWQHRRWHHRQFHPPFGFGGGDPFDDDGGAGSEWLGGDQRHGGWHMSDAFAERGPKWFLLRSVLRRLETTPTQERSLRDATKELKETARTLKDESRRSRADLAGAFRRSGVDEVALGEMFARHDGALESLRKAFVGWMIKVHEILDDTQRERLAELVERGPRWFRQPAPMGW